MEFKVEKSESNKINMDNVEMNNPNIKINIEKQLPANITHNTTLDDKIDRQVSAPLTGLDLLENRSNRRIIK
jgi:hypothetical protein